MELDAALFQPHTGPGRNPWYLREGWMLSGAGQCVESIYAMTLALGNAHKPALIALYEGLYETGYQPNPSVLEAPHLFPGALLQIGLQLPLFNTPGLLSIAGGQADHHIARMAARYASLPCPVLLRIGYEFDGAEWNGYAPDAYIAAYRRIAKGLEGAKNVALVWDSYTTDTPNVMDWYPGDDVVDWFGYNTLSPKFDCGRMLSLAKAHGKPLLNGEASYAMDARHLSFAQWIAQFFASLRTHQVGAYQYINWRWQVYPGSANWHAWQDGRFTEDGEKVAAYRQAMAGEDLVVRGASYRQPLRLVIDCARALEENAPAAPWRPEADHLTAQQGYTVVPEGATATYGNGWMGGWTGQEIILHISTPEDFSGALLLKPLANSPTRLLINGRKACWQPGDGYIRHHHLQGGKTQIRLSGLNGGEVRLDLIALMAYAPDVPSPHGLSLQGNTLHWHAPEGAACYSVYAGGALIGRTETPRFSLPLGVSGAAVSIFDPRRGEGKPAHLCMEDHYE